MSRTKYPKPVDCRGVQIELGHIIVYPVRRRSLMVMKEATVCEKPGEGCTIKKGVVALSPQGKKVIIEVTDRCAVVSHFNQRK